MDILWAKKATNIPENATILDKETIRGVSGDALLIEPEGPYRGRKVKPKGQWVELHPDKKWVSHLPKVWASKSITKPVGLISGFDINQTYTLAQLGIDRKLQKLDTEANIAIINGPNLNLLGSWQTELYGQQTLEQIFQDCKILAPNVNLFFRQSNSESEIVTMIQKLRHESDAIIINAGAYAHTSVAIADALQSFDDQTIALHISNPFQGELFRRTNLLAPTADSFVAGFGPFGYKLALIAACMRI